MDIVLPGRWVVQCVNPAHELPRPSSEMAMGRIPGLTMHLHRSCSILQDEDLGFSRPSELAFLGFRHGKRMQPIAGTRADA